MEYRVRVWSAMQGPGVPLRYVAEAMAKRAATGYGTLPLHGPTLENLRPELVHLLWDAAMSGQLTVCNNKGRVASATELIETASASVAEVAGVASAASITAENTLPYLFARQKHLIEWGETSGDVFLFVETPGTLVSSDLRTFTEAGFGEVIAAGYHRSAVGGGESEPWHDDLYDTAPRATEPAQSLAATPAPVMDGNEPAEQVNAMKKVALIAALEYEWPSIEDDMREATRNGLKAAAHTGKHGEWNKDKARAWAISKGKIKQSAPVHPLAGAWPRTTTRHTISK